jgi:hypothetical protein
MNRKEFAIADLRFAIERRNGRASGWTMPALPLPHSNRKSQIGNRKSGVSIEPS